MQLEEDDVYPEFVRREWCDGLPFVAPTRARVDAMLAGARAEGAESLGFMPPLWRECTLEALAVNAVMAGAQPSYFPAIVAAVQAMLDPAFNLYGVQATTHPVAPLAIVTGPYARAIGLHAGSGLFGPGFRANATIGRAIRLTLLNVGGAWPGRHDMATQGSPAKFSYAIAERDDVSPWEPLHVGLGFAPEESVVTVYGGEPPHNVNDHVSTTAPGILNNVADVAATLGSNVGWYMNQSQLLVVLGPGARRHHRGGRLDQVRRAALRLRARADLPRTPQARRHVGHARLADLDAEDHGRRGHAAPGALGGRHLRDGGGRVRQALRRRAQLHVQPSGEPPHRPNSVRFVRRSAIVAPSGGHGGGRRGLPR